MSKRLIAILITLFISMTLSLGLLNALADSNWFTPNDEPSEEPIEKESEITLSETEIVF